MASLTQTTSIPADYFNGGKNLNRGNEQGAAGHLAEIVEAQRVDIAAVNTEAAANTTARTANSAAITAMGAENTDVQIPIPILNGLAGSGTWTPTMQAAGPRLRRSAGANEEDYWIACPFPHRSTSSKGRKITGVAVNYEVATADAEDVRAEVYKVVMGADNAARTRTLLGGDQDAHYDADHDTATKRGDDTTAPELHRATVTLPSPAYLGVDEQIWVRLVVDGDAGAASVVDFTAAKLLASETLVDLA